MVFSAGEHNALLVTRSGEVPLWIERWLRDRGMRPIVLLDHEELRAVTLTSAPRLILIDAVGPTSWHTRTIDACAALKLDSFTSIVPVVVLCDRNAAVQWLEAGADEAIDIDADAALATARLAATMRRSDRDTDVHPSTRLPGTRGIEAELQRRVDTGSPFAVCYADLDHFKEFNDRYGWTHGDRVIRLLARILHDVVKGLCGREGFVGHIGGDDFLYVVPLSTMQEVCDEVIHVFEQLIPLQYSEQDRRAGYFMGKDRRGQLHRVPLMTLSVGVATNQRRHFTRASEVSELASEMKSYAKSISGSLWAVDRRTDDVQVSTPAVGMHAQPRTGTR